MWVPEERIKSLFNETVTENFPSIGIEMNIQIQETQKSPNKMNS